VGMVLLLLLMFFFFFDVGDDLKLNSFEER